MEAKNTPVANCYFNSVADARRLRVRLLCGASRLVAIAPLG